MAAPSTIVKTNLQGTITLKDTTGTPVTKALTYDKGDFSLSGLGPKLNEVNTIARRGKHLVNVHGARKYPEVSFSVWVTNLVGSSTSAPGTELEFLSILGAYSANTNPAGTGSRPVEVSIDFAIEGSSLGDSADETIAMTKVVVTGFDFVEAEDGNTLTFTGRVCGSVAITNSTNTVTLAEYS